MAVPACPFLVERDQQGTGGGGGGITTEEGLGMCKATRMSRKQPLGPQVTADGNVAWRMTASRRPYRQHWDICTSMSTNKRGPLNEQVRGVGHD